MSKSKVSDAFKNFESRNEHKLADARKEEKQSRGNPLPVGFVGTGVISDCKADISKKGDPYLTVEVTVVHDPNYEGKVITGAVRVLKDTEKQTKTDAMANFLDDLEDMGLSRETRVSKDIGGCYDELLATPHYVSISVTENNYTADKKGVKCFAVAAPDGSGRGPTAEDTTPVEEVEDEYKDNDQCIYLGKPHYVIEDNEDGTFDVMNIKTRKLRESISADDIVFTEGGE